MILLTFAIGAFMLCAFAGLALDVSYLQMWKRKAQTAADAAAQSAAIELKRTQNSEATIAAATADAEANGFGPAAVGTVSVETPPASGSHSGDARYVAARVSRPMPTYFMRLFGKDTITVTAVAQSGLVGMDSCIFVLNPSANNSLQVSGTPNVNLTCGIQVNSNSASALQVTGGAVITAPSFNVVGGAQITNNATITPPPNTSMSFEDDPLAWRANPTFGACDHFDFKISGNGKGNNPIPLDPGVYCGGIAINSQRPVILSPGLYVLAGGGLKINSQASVDGDGVTFFNTAVPGYSRGAISVTGGAVLSLRAPRSGPQEGLLIWEDRGIESQGPNHVEGHSESNLEGVIYMPNSDLNYAGGSGTVAQYANIVVNTLKFTGHSRFGSNYTVLASGPTLVRSVLVQ